MIPISSLTLGQASRHYDVSRSTLQRRLVAGQIPGARFDTESGEWDIPHGAMDEAGYEKRPPKVEHDPMVLDLRRQVEDKDRIIEDLRANLADLRASNDDLRGTIAHQRKALGAATEVEEIEDEVAEPVDVTITEPEVVTVVEVKRGLWARLTGRSESPAP